MFFYLALQNKLNEVVMQIFSLTLSYTLCKYFIWEKNLNNGNTDFFMYTKLFILIITNIKMDKSLLWK